MRPRRSRIFWGRTRGGETRTTRRGGCSAAGLRWGAGLAVPLMVVARLVWALGVVRVRV